MSGRERGNCLQEYSADRLDRSSANLEQFRKLRVFVDGVIRAGSLKSYLRMAHKEVLLLRGLAMKGYMAPRRRTRGTAEWKAAVAFLARLGDNGVVWNILSFWQEAE